MRWLLNLESKLNSLSLKERVLLYSIPVLVALLFLNYTQQRVENSDFIQKESIEFKQLHLYKKLNSFLKDEKIQLYSMEMIKNGVNLLISSKFKNLISLIKFCESDLNLEITYLKMKDTKSVKIDTTIRLIHKKYIEAKKYLEINTLYNPFKPKRVKRMKLYAIFGQRVIIDRKLLAKDEKYRGYRVIEIGKNSVVLEKIKDKKRVTLKVFHDK